MAETHEVSRQKGMLIGMPTRWDEACFAVPALRALIANDLVDTIVVHSEQVEFWKSVCDLSQIVFDAKSSARSLASHLKVGWGTCLLWEDGLVAKACAKAAIPCRYGPAGMRPARLFTHPLEIMEGSCEHRVQFYLKSCKLLEAAADQPEYFAPASLGVSQKVGSILLCPDSDYGSSYEWSLEKWTMLASALLEKGHSISIAGLANARGLSESLASALGVESVFFPKLCLSSCLPLLGGFELVVAADSSLPHLAAHAGARCVTLFGPNDSTWKRPLGRRHVVIKRHVECAPCLSAKCLLDSRCQNELGLQQVLDAIAC
jgi:Glycosyltransferase family 9 (heptosyltransferase)